MRAALFQSRTGIDPVANAAALVDAIDAAKAGGADMLFTPEMSGLLDANRARSATHHREEPDDPVLAAVRAAAADARLWVQLGSLAIALPDGKLANRSFLIDDAGAIRARYDKIHLFDVDLPSGGTWRESSGYARGERAVAADTPWGRLGLTVCYDLRFPDLYRALTDAGATTLSVPAAFTAETGKAHWHVLLRARAIEAGVFVIAAAQSGRHEDGRETFGHALVVDPWGEVLLDMGTETGVGFAEVDLERVTAVRRRVAAIDHRVAVGPVTVAP